MNGPRVLSPGPQVSSRGLYLLFWWVEQDRRTQRRLFLTARWNPEGTVRVLSLLSRIGFSIKVEEEERKERKDGGCGEPGAQAG